MSEAYPGDAAKGLDDGPQRTRGQDIYLHQENAVWMYRTPAIADMTADFEQTVAKSRRITLADVRATPWWRRALWTLLRTFSPLM